MSNLRVIVFKSFSELQPAVWNKAKPPPVGVFWLQNLFHKAHGDRVPVARNDAAVFVRHLRRSVPDLVQDGGDAEKDVSRLEAGDRSGKSRVSGNNFIRLLTDDGADMPRVKKPGDLDLSGFQDRLERRGNQPERGQDGIILQVVLGPSDYDDFQ